ncbi:tetratricopeptide repeat-containing glycosyltransferase family protein [Telmatospirillum sp.]|uniref:tetratricopeptide repeat-containing glycosyltransferase family protein n=1 Tax=Telmatospirillum sp. TaxID=2079197 RepID=UPI00284722FB|nr:tetratricopeptide repeat-containing glycosyltransferase family protein [Telmatospirillum sp.]MDR3441041.1 tetratricopeptide repeat-containing glycosyltransferase family protein [Telmatospirillum sp.]
MTVKSEQPLFSLIFEEAVARHRLDQKAEAEALYRAVLAIHPRHAEASYNLGLLCQMEERYQEAANLYRRAIAFRNDYVDAYSNLGTVLKELKEYEQANTVYLLAIAIKPDHAMAYSNLGVSLKEQRRFDEAVAVYRQAITLAPDYEWAYANQAPVLLEQGDSRASIIASQRAITLTPDMSLAHYNLAAALKAENLLQQSVDSFRHAIALRPDFGEAHFALGQVLLMQGDYEAGWPEYSWRWSLPDYAWLSKIHGQFQQPLWTGERLDGKTILIYAEQGMGDAIQYARYLPKVLGRGGRIVLAVHPPLKKLFAAIPGIAAVVGLDETPLPPFDVHCPLLGLPQVFGTRQETIPAQVPYLQADPAETERWKKRIGGDGLKVGIVWAGNPTQRGDRWRSPRLASMAPLFNVPGVRFVALQMGPGRADLETNPLPANVLDLGPEITDFADTAAIMAGLDLVITSCTAPLHLAGALGVPTWAVIPFAPHFLWQLDRSDSPWYPTLHLYRQTKPGRDWSVPIGRVVTDLSAMVEKM